MQDRSLFCSSLRRFRTLTVFISFKLPERPAPAWCHVPFFSPLLSAGQGGRAGFPLPQRSCSSLGCAHGKQGSCSSHGIPSRGQGEQQEHCVLLGSIPSSRAGRAGQLAVGWDPAELTSPRSVLRIHLSCSMPPRDKQAAGPPWGCSELVLAHSQSASSTRLSSGSRPVPGGGVAGTSEGLVLPGSLHSTRSQTRGLPHGVLVWLWGRQEQSLGRVPAAGRRWGCGVPRGFQRLVPGISGE